MKAFQLKSTVDYMSYWKDYPKNAQKRLQQLRKTIIETAEKSEAVDILEETLKWAKSLANRAPLSLAATKKAMRHATSGSWASTFDVEASLQANLRQSEDCVEGVTAFFVKRAAKFKGK